MIWRVLASLVVLALLSKTDCKSQEASYFNFVEGDVEAGISHTASNLVMRDSDFTIWGAGVDNGILFHFLRRYNLEGELLDSAVFVFADVPLFAGIRTSFQYNPYTNQYVFFQGAGVNGANPQGRMLVFNDELGLIQNLYFDLHPPETYFFGFLVEPDGYIVSGEMGSGMGVFPTYNGTFLAKIDFEGNVIWNRVLKPRVPGFQYRNNYLLKTENGYLLTGWGRSNSNSWGQITFTDQQGFVVHDLVMADPSVLLSGIVFATRGNDNSLRMLQGLSYEDHPSDNPYLLYTKMRVFEFNEVTLDTIHLIDLFTNYDFTSFDGFSELITTTDNGMLIVGSRLTEESSYRPGYLLKLAEDSSIEWYKEYNWMVCDECENQPYDIEPTPDGGYVVAGYFVNYAENPRQRVWIFKVDACGDLEWQGCSPLNVPERKGQSFSIYPNPSRGRFTVETSSQKRVRAWRMHDLSGRQVAQGTDNSNAAALVIDQNLSSGMYLLKLELDGGKVEAYKVQVSR